jgi:hypothetical protein
MVIRTIGTMGTVGTLGQLRSVLDPDTEQLLHPFAETIEARIAHFPDD